MAVLLGPAGVGRTPVVLVSNMHQAQYTVHNLGVHDLTILNREERERVEDHRRPAKVEK